MVYSLAVHVLNLRFVFTRKIVYIVLKPNHIAYKTSDDRNQIKREYIV